MLNLTPNPPPATAISVLVKNNWYWPDNSMFCYDLVPQYVLNGWADANQSGGVYDIPNLYVQTIAPQYNGWTNWVDKAQKDYRFTALSDSNSQLNMFPEVSDPWMFTEYIAEGTTTANGQDQVLGSQIDIIRPPLVKPTTVTRTLDSDGNVTNATPLFYTENITTTVTPETRLAYELEYQWQSGIAPFLLYWECELDQIGWVEWNGGVANGNFTRTTVTRRRVRFQHPSVNAGVRMNRAAIFARSTHWGQSGNVPARVLNMTAPPDWLNAKDQLTGRIVPSVQVIQGSPVYDTTDQTGGQGAAWFGTGGIQMGTWSWSDQIGVLGVTPSATSPQGTYTGTNGIPTSVWYYTAPATSANVVLAVLPTQPLVATSQPAYTWLTQEVQPGDLVHRGCSFWQGHAVAGQGTCGCSYATQYASQFAALNTQVYSDFVNNTFQKDLNQAVIPQTQTVTVTLGESPAGPWHDLASCGFTMQLITDPSDGTIVRVSLVKGTPGAAMPWAITCYCIQIVPKNYPVPHNTLCASYNGTAADPKSAYATMCQQNGFTACPFYTPTGMRIMATWECIASNGAEWAAMQRGLPPGQQGDPSTTDAVTSAYQLGATSAVMDGGLGMAMAMSVSSLAAALQTPAYVTTFQKDTTSSTIITFAPETVAVAGKQTYYNTPGGLPPEVDPDDALRVQPGTGYHVIDWETDAPYNGVDGVFFGYVNQINYRVMSSVQHCYSNDLCNPLILAVNNPPPGWRRGAYSNINFKTHALCMPGYPAADCTSRYCNFGCHQCPKTQLDRRAAEYDKNYQVLLNEIYIPFSQFGITAFATGTDNQPILTEGFLLNGQVQFLTKSQFVANPTAMCVAVARVSGNPILLGHWMPQATDSTGQKWWVYFYYDHPSWDPLHHLSRVFAHIVQFDGNDQPSYMTITDPGDIAAITALFGAGTVNTLPWLVELYDKYQPPTGNLIYATNSLPFAGGRNPEYKDHSHRGTEIMSWCGGYTGMDGADGATWTNQFGGPLNNTAPVQSRYKMGYWPMKYGEFINQSIPIPNPGAQPPPFVPVMARIFNAVSWYNGAVPIDGAPSLGIEDTESNTNTQSVYAAVGHTFSTDTAALIQWFNTVNNGETNWHAALPYDPNDPTGTLKVQVAAPCPDVTMLPLERYWFQCNVCGIDFTPEEVNFLAGYKAMLAPIPTGATGNPPCGCPRMDGGWLVNMGHLDHLMDTHARGFIDLWGPPGTTVHRDGFFWKNPTLVTRVHGDHIMQKLGQFNSNGGGYSFSNLTGDVELLGSLPPCQTQGYNPGLGHALTLPWVKVGDTVATARINTTPIMGLYNTDVCQYYNGKTNTSTNLASSVTSNQEATTVLQAGDQISFWRQNTPDPAAVAMDASTQGDWYELGLPICAVVPLTSLVATDPIVLADPACPQRSSYSVGVQGDIIFREALRQWRIGIVQGSLYDWATAGNPGMSVNALKDQLLARGVNAKLADEVDPNTGALIAVDERVLAPYGVNPGGGLKMATLPVVKNLRNRLLPMMAYDLSDPIGGYTAGGDYTSTQQVDDLDRYDSMPRVLPIQKWTQIQPQVMAATASNFDYYVQWQMDNDLAGTNVRAYYPVGKTWWRINQKIGQIKRQGGWNPLHLDDCTRTPWVNPADGGIGPWCYYTGDWITSAVGYFMFGRLPMHMEVVKAYIVFTQEPGPSAGPIGCQGGYTGMVGYEYPGSSQLYDLTYAGNAQCYWQHYHAWRTPGNQGDNGKSHENCLPQGVDNYWGPSARQHTIDHPDDWSITDWLVDGTGTPMGQSPDEPQVVLQESIETGVDVDDYQCWLGDTAAGNYLNMVDILTMNFVDTSYGFGFSQPYFAPWVWGQDMQQLMTEYQCWKDMTFAQYSGLVTEYHAVCRAAMEDKQITWDYYAECYRNQIYPAEHQGVAGWIDFTNYNSTGQFANDIPIATQVTDTSWADGPQVIVQGGGGPPGGPPAGDATRVLDVTSIITQKYNDRVPRFFQCQLGWSLATLAANTPPMMDTNLGLNPAFHQHNEDPEPFMTYRYIGTLGMWLNDPWHHPPVFNGEPVQPDEDGDPLVLLVADEQARIQNVSSWDTQNLASTAPNYMQYHPWQLCQANQPFIESSPVTMAAPIQLPNYYWRNIGRDTSEQSFEVDLRQLPIETMRRNWRYNAPTVNSANAICPNVASCTVAQNHWTVSQFYQIATSSWGWTVVPSMTSQYCACCGTQMTAANGVVFTDGDGITTVSYDPPWMDDLLVTGIDIGIASTDGWLPAAAHGIIIEGFNSLSQMWSTIFSAAWNAESQTFSYDVWNGSAWATVNTAALPTTLVGAEGVGVVPKFAAAANGCHFLICAASTLRIRVNQPWPDAREVPGPAGSGNWGTGVVNTNGTMSIPLSDCPVDVQANANLLIQTTIRIQNTLNSNQRNAMILSASIAGSSVILTLGTSLATTETKYRITWTDFVARMTTLRVWGWPYQAGKLTITPSPLTQVLAFTAGNSDLQLTNWPSKIFAVTANAGIRQGLNLTRAASLDPSVFTWQVQSILYNGSTHLEVTGGAFFYDNTRNTLRLPTTYVDPTSGQQTSIWSLNAALYGNVTTPLLTPTLPNLVTVQYLSGNGVSIDVPVTSCGPGPTYQLDKESICFIAGHSPDTQTAIPSYVNSNPTQVLPNMGFSENLIGNNNQPMQMYWQTYNHDKTYWNGGVKWLVGDELTAANIGEDGFLSIFSGTGMGRNMDELGADAALTGSCSGTVTLYGMPNTILSGNLSVYAKAYTTRTYNLPTGAVTFAERTGGFRSGACVFYLTIDDVVTGNRKGIQAGVPKLLVYLRERDLDPANEPSAPLITAG